MSTAGTTRGRGRHPAEPVVRLLVVAGLAVDTVVHLRLADAMQLAAPGGIGGGTLFRVQAVAAAVVAVVVLVTGHRLAYLLAALVALSALGPVLLYTYVDVPAIGPVPSLHDPFWYPEKTLSAVAEAVALVLALVGFRLASRRRVPAQAGVRTSDSRRA